MACSHTKTCGNKTCCWHTSLDWPGIYKNKTYSHPIVSSAWRLFSLSFYLVVYLGTSVFLMPFSHPFLEALVLYLELLVVGKLLLVRHFPRYWHASDIFFFFFLFPHNALIHLFLILSSTPILTLLFMWVVEKEEMKWQRFVVKSSLLPSSQFIF